MSPRTGLPQHWIGLASDLEVAPPEVLSRGAGDGIAVHYPDRRDFHDLNALWPAFTPGPEDLPSLLASWETEFGGTGVEARILCWEELGSEEDPDSPWAARDTHGDFELSQLEVLRCTEPNPVARSSGLEVRAAETDEDWRQVVAVNLAAHRFDDLKRADFNRWMIGERHRSSCESGRAAWWAAWLDGQAVGAAGLYAGEGCPARFQEVVTHRDHRRRGVCTTLLSTILERSGSKNSLLIAESGSEATRIYRRLGFEPVSRIRQLFQRLPPSDPD